MWRKEDPVPEGSFQAAKSNSQNQEQFSLFLATSSRNSPRSSLEVRNQILRLEVKICLSQSAKHLSTPQASNNLIQIQIQIKMQMQIQIFNFKICLNQFDCNTFEVSACSNQANWLPACFESPIDCRRDFGQFSTHTCFSGKVLRYTPLQ